MFGERRVMDSGWADRAQQDIKDRNAWSYNKMLNAAKESYANQSAQNDAWWDENEKNPIMRAIGKADTKLINWLSGQGTEKSFLKRHGFTPEIQEAGAAGNISSSDLGNYLNNVERSNTKEMDTAIGAVAGLNNIPVVGSILNYLTAPVAQLAGAGRDLQTGVQGDWNRWNQRDHVSDAAALGKVGLEALTAGMGTPATLGSKVGFGMATGAADNALDTIREQGSNVNAGDLLSSAGVGAAFGGAIPLAGAGLNKAGSSLAARGANVLSNAGVDPASVAKSTQVGLGLRNLGASGVNRFRNLTTPQKALMLGGAGAGTIGIANLLNRNNQQPQLSDEDLAALYNYYGVGE